MLFILMNGRTTISISFNTYIHTAHAKGVGETYQISLQDAHVYQNDLAMRNTADVTDGKPIAVCLQYISGVSSVNPLVAFYDIHGR
jgi:hypothetical protein